VITLGLVGYALNTIFVRIERHVLRWHIESH
jgi:ABC-type nitrate/sulfonate/bicarbonate transport system permease component